MMRVLMQISKLKCFAVLTMGLLIPVLTIAQPPKAVINPSQSPKIIDGVMGKGEWDKAAQFTNFVTLLPEAMSEGANPEAYICYDADNLYVAFNVKQQSPPRKKSGALKLDGALWLDDSVEIFVQPVKGKWPYFQFMGNFRGQRFDGRGKDKNWNGKWEYAAKVFKGYWQAEFAIPWKTLNMKSPVDGKIIGLNMGNSRKLLSAVEYDTKPFTWAPTAGLHKPQNFGTITLTSKLPVIQWNAASKASEIGGNVRVVNNAGKSQKVDVKLKIIRKQDSKVVYDKNIAQDVKSNSANIIKRTLKSFPGEYNITLKALDVSYNVNKICFEHSWNFLLPQELNVELRKYFFHDKIQPMVYLKGDASQHARITFRLLSGKKQIKAANLLAAKVSEATNDPRWHKRMGKQVSTIFDISKLAPGPYSVKISVAESGEKTKNAWLHFNKPKQPVWIDSKIGISRKVPKPFKPVDVNGMQVSVLERKYKLNKNSMFEQITARDKDILAGPVRLFAKIGKKNVVWKNVKNSSTQDGPDKVVFESVDKADGLKVSTKTSIEFDGLARFDVNLSGVKGEKIESFGLEIPIKKEHAKLFQAIPETTKRGRNRPWPSWSGSPNGRTLRKPTAGPFTFAFWVGDDYRGLWWTTASYQHWVMSNPKKTIELIPDGDKYIVRINFIDAPAELNNPRDYIFAMQATPVRKPGKPEATTVVGSHARKAMQVKTWRVGNGRLVYPTPGLTSQKGSITLWMRSQNDSKNHKKLNRNLMTLLCADGKMVELVWTRDRYSLVVQKRDGKKTEAMLIGAIGDHKKSQQTITFSWGKKTTLYLDGKLVKAADSQGLAGLDSPVTQIQISAGAIVDAISINSEPFNGKEKPKPEICKSTLLLDKFTNIKGDDLRALRTCPEVFAGAKNGQNSARINGYYDVLSNPDGSKSIRLSGGYEDIDYFTLLKRDKKFDWIMFAEYWGELEGNPYTVTRKEDLKWFVENAHKAGLKVMLHTTAVYGNLSKEWELYSDEFLSEPKRVGFVRMYVEPQLSYYQAITGQWQNFMVYHYDKLIRDFDLDGLYFDGNYYPAGGDRNQWHGAGFIDENGKLQPTWQIFEYREWMKRIRNIGNSYKPDFRIDIHCLLPYTPTIAIADSTLSGEQYQMVADVYYNSDLRKCMTLDAFRTNCTGTAFGLQAELHCAATHDKNLKIRLAQCYSILHGVPYRSFADHWTNQAMLSYKLDNQSSEWHPYYENRDLVVCKNPDVKVSFFVADDGRWLIFVLNTGYKTSKVTLEFTDKNKKLPINRMMYDCRSGRYIGPFKSEITLELKPWNIRAISVE